MTVPKAKRVVIAEPAPAPEAAPEPPAADAGAEDDPLLDDEEEEPEEVVPARRPNRAAVTYVLDDPPELEDEDDDEERSSDGEDDDDVLGGAATQIAEALITLTEEGEELSLTEVLVDIRDALDKHNKILYAGLQLLEGALFDSPEAANKAKAKAKLRR